MEPVYIISTEGFSGKTGLCASIAMHARSRDIDIGYMKPVGTLPTRVDGKLVDEDCVSLRDILGLEDPAEAMSPIVMTPQFIHAQLARPSLNAPAMVMESFRAYSKGKQLVILEGMSHPRDGRWLGLSSRQVCRLLHAKAILLAKFEHELAIDAILAAKDMLGESYLGAILNWTPEGKMPLVNDCIVPFLTDQGVNVLGVVPKDERLLAVTVAELLDELEGRLVAGEDCMGESIESFMVGAMGQEKALTFFRQRENKAVITGGDREEVQLAALETATRALVLTGNQEPTRRVSERAKELGVAVIVVDMDTLSAVGRTEAMVGRVRVHDAARAKRTYEMLSSAIDFDALLDRLIS